MYSIRLHCEFIFKHSLENCSALPVFIPDSFSILESDLWDIFLIDQADMLEYKVTFSLWASYTNSSNSTAVLLRLYLDKFDSIDFTLFQRVSWAHQEFYAGFHVAYTSCATRQLSPSQFHAYFATWLVFVDWVWLHHWTTALASPLLVLAWNFSVFCSMDREVSDQSRTWWTVKTSYENILLHRGYFFWKTPLQLIFWKNKTSILPGTGTMWAVREADPHCWANA